ncbi:MAG: 50S ribosomal protein L25/general stress protein Ctc [Legionellales bacterium]|jgi:large subunit ribosomal protein L25|nr:50S ribosomal protein L25/general stress protein Ctc [Legionellales bacterium]
MSQVLEMTAINRNEVGRGETRALCKKRGLVPAVIYGAGKDNQNIYLNAKEINHAMQKSEFYSHIIELDVDGNKEQVMLKDSQIHPNKGTTVHVDFFRIDSSSAIKISLPLIFDGEDTAPGVKAGGVVTHLLTELEVKCLPADLPVSIHVDVASLDLGGKVHLSEVKLPKGVEFTAHVNADHDPTIITIHEPRASSSDDEDTGVVEEEKTDSQE